MPADFDKPSWSLVVAANSDALLHDNLLRSGEERFAKEIIIRRNAPNSATAYNAGMAGCTGDVVVFAHQDVFLPAGWSERMRRSIEELTCHDPQWGALGLYGITRSGKRAGHVYSTGLRSFVGRPLSEPIQIGTLDEMLLIIRRTAGLRFDEKLPGFHLYGTDICMEAEARGMRNYVLPCFALHNSTGMKKLPLGFWRAYLYLRSKWRDRLPIATPCTVISNGCSPIVGHIMTSYWSSIRGTNTPGSRVDDPKRFFEEQIAATVEFRRTGRRKP